MKETVADPVIQKVGEAIFRKEVVEKPRSLLSVFINVETLVFVRYNSAWTF